MWHYAQAEVTEGLSTPHGSAGFLDYPCLYPCIQYPLGFFSLGILCQLSSINVAEVLPAI